MDDNFSRGLAFEISDLFRKSSFLQDGNEESIFPSLDTNVPGLKTLQNDSIGHFDLGLDVPELPVIESGLDPAEGDIEGIAKHDGPPERDEDMLADDIIWDLDLSHADGELPKFCSWEAFGKQDVPGSDGTHFLSEAGPAAFDASMKHVEKSIGVLPSDYVLRSLSSLLLGRSSSLFQWNSATGQFKPTLEDAALSGVSLQCTTSTLAKLMEAGRAVAILRDFSTPSKTNRNDCAALMALRSCTSDILDAIDEIISSGLAAIRSVLQLQQLVTRPQYLLGLVQAIVERTKGLEIDESVISSVSDQIHQDAENSPLFASLFRILLARISLPWLESLAVDLGFSNSLTRMNTEYTISEDCIPAPDGAAFLDSRDKDLIKETKNAVATLRQQVPTHPALKPQRQAPEAVFCRTSFSQSHASQVARQYEHEVLQEMRQQQGVSVEGKLSEDENRPIDVSLWQGQAAREAYIREMGTEMSSMPMVHSSHSSDDLFGQVKSALSTEECLCPDSSQDLATHLFLSPIDHIRPLIRVQHQVLNGVILRHLLRTHNLKHHLNLQNSFQLLGNGIFVSRLSTALFSRQVQSAERRRGIVPTAETMGLRVGATKDQRWPPASSELQLTLMGLLSDETSRSSSSVKEYLSFAIRELPEEEIDRVLDPHSIYALDFLRLQYTAAPPLDSVLTKSVLDQYDSIFRYLLKLQRVLHAVVDMPRIFSDTELGTPDLPLQSFRSDAHQFITTLLSHTMDVCISSPWRAFMSAISSLERDIAAEDVAGEIGTKARLGVEGLRNLHEACLDRMRIRLFLKRKQIRLTEGVERVLSAILENTSRIQEEGEEGGGDGEYEGYQKAVGSLLALLTEAANKPLKSIDNAEAEDLEILRMLIRQLEAGRGYAGTST